jgi:hypothetical protein
MNDFETILDQLTCLHHLDQVWNKMAFDLKILVYKDRLTEEQSIYINKKVKEYFDKCHLKLMEFK